MSVAGSFIRVTGKESADFAAASAFSGLALVASWHKYILCDILND